MKEDFLRVTEVISPYTGIEFVPEHFLNAAAERGTKVHQYIENFFNCLRYEEVDFNLTHYMDSFYQYWEENQHQYMNFTVENRYFCNDLMITGQVDLINHEDDKITIVDWKTSSRPHHKAWALQSAAYRYLIEQNNNPNVRVDNVLFVLLKKDGKKPTLHKYDDYERNLDIFLKCLELYRHFDMDKTRRKNEN